MYLNNKHFYYFIFLYFFKEEKHTPLLQPFLTEIPLASGTVPIGYCPIKKQASPPLSNTSNFATNIRLCKFGHRFCHHGTKTVKKSNKIGTILFKIFII
jgi:hypothetical protein